MIVNIDIEDNHDKIREVVEECDNSFLVGVTRRDNYLQILAKMQKYAYIIVARNEKGTTMGYASMYANDKVNYNAFISMFCVRKEFQGNHLGTSLMNKCVEIARTCGMNKIRLEVLNQNERGYAFYSRYGFITIDQLENCKVLGLDL